MSHESTGFLNRCVDTDGHDVGALLSDLVATAGAKAAESSRLRRSSLEALDSDLEQAAQAISERFRAGACLYTFGNGASSTDAACVAALFARSPGGALLPARCLVADPAVLTAQGTASATSSPSRDSWSRSRTLATLRWVTRRAGTRRTSSGLFRRPGIVAF